MMIIKNEVEDELLGKIYCLADGEDNMLVAWAKKDKILQEKEIWVYLDMYYSDVNYRVCEELVEDFIELRDGINKIYNEIQLNKTEIMKNLLKTLNEEKEFGENFKANDIEIIEMRIFQYGYSIIFSIKEIDELLSYEVGIEGEGIEGITLESESKVVSMEYDEIE